MLHSFTHSLSGEVSQTCDISLLQSDVGGMKTLQKRWTTFLKAELVCEDKPSGQRFNVLADVFTTEHTPGDPKSTHFYGLFTSQWYACGLVPPFNSQSVQGPSNRIGFLIRYSQAQDK